MSTLRTTIASDAIDQLAARLAQLKATYDPTNLFQLNQNIKLGPAK